MDAACTEREQDPQGSEPIDEMQARPSLPLRHAEVLAGVERAERLMPVAKNLATESLRALLREYGVRETAAVRAAFFIGRARSANDVLRHAFHAVCVCSTAAAVCSGVISS